MGASMRRPWEKYKEEMVRLYIDERNKLDDVMRIMDTQFGFRASKRAYRCHFDIWGIGKYNCKKRNERRKRRQHLPSPSMTVSSTQSSVVQTSREPKHYSFAQQNHEYHSDAFNTQSLPQSTGLAFQELTLPYPGAISESQVSPLPGPSLASLGHCPPPIPEPGEYLHPKHTFKDHHAAHLHSRSAVVRSLQSILSDAISCQDASRVRTVIRQGARLDMPDAKGSYPIHEAAACSEPLVMQILLESGANPSATDRYGRTPLFSATTIGPLAILLSQRHDVNVAHKDVNGDTYLHVLLRAPFWYADVFTREAVRILLEHARDPDSALLDVPDVLGMTPFHLAVSCTRTRFNPQLLEPLSWMLARNPEVRSPMVVGNVLPLCALVEKIQVYLSRSREPLSRREWDSLHAVLSRFLDISPPRMYPARLLRVLLSPKFFFVSVSRLWNFIWRLVVHGVGDVSSPDERGRTALQDVLYVGYDAVAAQGHFVEERVTALLRALYAGTGGQAVDVRDGQGRAPWESYVSAWRDQSRRHDRQVLEKEWDDDWGAEMKLDRVVGWGDSGRPRVECVEWPAQGLEGVKSAVKREY